MPVDFDIIVFEEEGTFVAYCPELDVSSCADTVREATENVKTAVRLFLEEAERSGTLEDILDEAGYRKSQQGKWQPPRIVATTVGTVH